MMMPISMHTTPAKNRPTEFGEKIDFTNLLSCHQTFDEDIVKFQFPCEEEKRKLQQ